MNHVKIETIQNKIKEAIDIALKIINQKEETFWKIKFKEICYEFLEKNDINDWYWANYILKIDEDADNMSVAKKVISLMKNYELVPFMDDETCEKFVIEKIQNIESFSMMNKIAKEDKMTKSEFKKGSNIADRVFKNFLNSIFLLFICAFCGSSLTRAFPNLKIDMWFLMLGIYFLIMGINFCFKNFTIKSEKKEEEDSK